MPLDSHADVDIGGRETAGATSPKKMDVVFIIIIIYIIKYPG